MGSFTLKYLYSQDFPKSLTDIILKSHMANKTNARDVDFVIL